MIRDVSGARPSGGRTGVRVVPSVDAFRAHTEHPTGSGGRDRQPCGRGLWQRANLKGAAGRLKSYNLADFDRLPQCTTQGSASLEHVAAYGGKHPPTRATCPRRGSRGCPASRPSLWHWTRACACRSNCDCMS